jgi:hypothetical protein
MRRTEAARSDRSLQRMQLHCAVGWVDVHRTRALQRHWHRWGHGTGRHVLDVASSVLYVALQVLDELEAGIAAGNSQPLPPDRLVSLAQCLRALP